MLRFLHPAILLIFVKGYKRVAACMKDGKYTLYDINEEIAESADLYLRTVIINRKRQYIRRIIKLSRHGITMLELEKYESNFTFNDSYFEERETTYFCIKGVDIPINTPELAEALSTLSEISLQVIMQSEVLKISIENIAQEFGVSKRTINTYKRNAIEELRKKLKDYEM